MRKLSRIVAVIGALVGASLTVTSTPATAQAPPETGAGSPSLTTIRANFARTAHVAEEARRTVKGAGSMEIGVALDGTVTAKILSGKRAAPSAVAKYPTIGPYWDTIRWGDAPPYLSTDSRVHIGHPFVCFYDTDNISSIHPIASAARRWNTNDFVTVWDGDSNSGGWYACWQLSNYWKAQTSSGGRTDVCNHTYMHWNSDNIVDRMIGYWDHEAFNWSCFDYAEINTFRTASTMGLMQGLRFHVGDGSPSLMAQSAAGPVYLWPQTYDFRTKDWFN